MNDTNNQFQIDPRLSAIAVAYSNPDYTLIADEVLPRVKSARKFKYKAYDEAAMFTLPDTRVGPRSAPNQVEIDGEERDASVEDYGIDVPLDNPTIEEAEAAGYDPKAQATERATNIVLLDREVRTAKVISDPALYHEDNKIALTGSERFSDPSSNPIKIVSDMLSACWMTPNQLVFGYAAWAAFRTHPKIVKAVTRSSGDSGMATREEIAQLFEVQRVLVGESRVNINRPGLKAEVNRTWGNIIAGQFIDRTVTPETGGVTFGLTAENGNRVSGTLQANMGLRGGILVRSGESVKEIIIANRAGFLISNAA